MHWLPSCFLRRNTYFSTSRTYASVTLLSSEFIADLLQIFIDSESPSQGRAIHTRIIQSGLVPNTNISIKLLVLHLKCGFSCHARNVFDRMPCKTLSAYKYMIAGYFKDGCFDEMTTIVRELALSNERPDGFTLSMVLKLSAYMGSLGLAMRTHAQCIRLVGHEMDDVLASSIVDSYVKNGSLNRACKMFDMLPRRDLVSATALIVGFFNQGSYEEAERVFQNTNDKDVVVLNAMIEGYSKTVESCPRSFRMYKDMLLLCFWPTISTFVSVMGACSLLSDLEFGQQIHTQISKTNSFTHVKIGSALIDMYSKCGRIEDAHRVFVYMTFKNVVSWTSMIDGFGRNGMPHEALKLFSSMRSTNVKPNHATFLIVLSACNHAGLLSHGKEIIESMEKEYYLKPRMEHYACLVDLLGRFGKLEEAYSYIKGISDQEPNSDVWAALLGASRLHGDVLMADIAANEIFKLSRNERPGAYVALSNVFADAGDWRSVCELRDLMKDQGVSKDTGFSWV